MDNDCQIKDCEFPRVYLLWEQNFKDLKKGQDELAESLKSFIKTVSEERAENIKDKIEAAKNSWVPRVMAWLVGVIGAMTLIIFGVSKFLSK